ncbi:MAG: DUF1669 domain-containing protein [Chlamydiales bacterium]|nr:DUF1669 domain-containing protein [Chlamydiales bacterium]
MPEQSVPLRFYSNQMRQDIKLLFLKALLKAEKSIDLCMYGITDKEIIQRLASRSDAGIPVHIEYDKKASSSKLLSPLNSKARLIPSACKGLMHRKILIIDEKWLLLGTANLTTPSLKHHNNLVLGIYSPSLASFLKNPITSHYIFSIQDTQAELFLLPDKDKKALEKLISTLRSAEKTIQIAMFTLTHPQIAEELAAAQSRGVQVLIAIDRYTAKGASKKCLKKLSDAGIEIFASRGKELLHHKWALIDEKVLIVGSANWTLSAFKKNEDLLLFLPLSTPREIRYLKNLWEILRT